MIHKNLQFCVTSWYGIFQKHVNFIFNFLTLIAEACNIFSTNHNIHSYFKSYLNIYYASVAKRITAHQKNSYFFTLSCWNASFSLGLTLNNFLAAFFLKYTIFPACLLKYENFLMFLSFISKVIFIKVQHKFRKNYHFYAAHCRCGALEMLNYFVSFSPISLHTVFCYAWKTI